jgi:hypothetical protein
MPFEDSIISIRRKILTLNLNDAENLHKINSLGGLFKGL